MSLYRKKNPEISRKKEVLYTNTTPVSVSMDEDTSASGAIFTHCTFYFTGLYMQRVFVFESFPKEHSRAIVV